jgi:DNA-binding transcriptional LysR family regulator
MDRFQALSVFVAVVEKGSFAAAAADLGISRNMASRHVMALEDHLAARLVNRTTRRVSLTSLGTAYFERAKAILADLAAADCEASLQSLTPRGRLRVNAPVAFGRRHVAPGLKAYMDRFPEVELELTLNDRFVDLIDEGYDLAVRIGRLTDSSLIARQLGEIETVACAAPDYLAARGTPQHPSDLAGHDCLGYAYATSRNVWSFAGPEGDVEVKVKPRLWSNNGDALTAAAVAGCGIVPQPVFLVRDALLDGRLRRILTGYRLPTLGVYAIYPHSRQLSLRVRTFIDHLVAQFSPPPWRLP